MSAPRSVFLAACLVLTACHAALSPASDRAGRGGVTAVLLDQGRAVAGAQIRLTSSLRPSQSTVTTTDAKGRFLLAPGDSVVRIEATGEDYHAVGEISPPSSAITCKVGSKAAYAAGRQGQFWSGNDIEWKPGRSITALNCRQG
ncbi:carboxypeptidase-like regulatory domain-containing protein [Labrys neptuniae]